MKRDLSRLLRPDTVAVIGGGAWCRSVNEQLLNAGFEGNIWPVNPHAERSRGLPPYASVLDLPQAPDAAFIGINRKATIGVVDDLSRMGAGGAVCFASGFGETNDGADLNDKLLDAAKEMPILGPNCYGLINALDGACLWPDQHGCQPVESGVAILTQSSNIAINLTMQKRGLPIAYVVTCGNQAQLSMADIGLALLNDPRVTALGLHIEGFMDLPAWQRLAREAARKNIPLIALKVGKSTEAQAATVSHTASLAGGDAGASALLCHLGITRVDDLPSLLETLKIMHIAGRLPSGRIASISCSGGEASLMADMAHHHDLQFPPLTETQTRDLSAALGPKVALANPLDYHTYIWRDTDAMTAAFSAMIDPDLAITFLIVDIPRADTCDPSDWDCVIDAAIRTRADTGGTIAMVASLPELMPEDVAARLSAGGVIPLNGLAEALNAAQAARIVTPSTLDLIVPPQQEEAAILTEDASKAELSSAGLTCPRRWSGRRDVVLQDITKATGPFVLKSVGQAHKSDTGGVRLGLVDAQAVATAAADLNGPDILVEEMVTGAVAELLVGVVKDPVHGFIVTIGAGGIFTELLEDTCSVLLPSTREQIEQSLTRLKMVPILQGYRNRPAANLAAIVDAIDTLQSYVLANLASVEEVEVNPLIVTQDAAIVADALIRKRHD